MPTNVILDEKFTESVRGSVQGNLARDIKKDTTPNASAIMVSAVAGAGLGIFLNKSPILFGFIGAIMGGLIIKIAK